VAELLTEAVILRSFPSGESDLLVHLFTRQRGKVRALAKGAKRSKKRFMNCLDDYGLVLAGLVSKADQERIRIDSCRLLARPDLSARPLLLGLGGLMTELTGLFNPELEPDQVLFQALKHCLLGLPESPAPLSLGLAFAFRLLLQAGFGPDLAACLKCGRPLEKLEGGGFIPESGGLICPRCRPSPARISLGGLKTIRLCQHLEPAALVKVRFPAVDQKELLNQIGRYLVFFAGREIKSLSFLDRVEGVETGGRTWSAP